MKIAAMCLCVFAVIVPAASLSTPAQTKSAARASAAASAARASAAASASAHGQPIEIAIAPGLDVKYPLTGRVLVCIAKIEKTETGAAGGNGATGGAAAGDAPAPCNQIEYDYTSQQVFGQDVTNLTQGQLITLD